jgi:hypothetical protein
MTIPRVLIAVRDLLVPGQVLGFIPNDDTYLKVMNASSKGGVADMFFSQLQALYMLILCLYKWWTIFVWLGSGFGGAHSQTCGGYLVAPNRRPVEHR